MSTPAADDVAVPKTTPYTLTRGALYLIEGLLQCPDPFNTTILTRRAAKLWTKLRKLNKPVGKIDGEDVNFERNYTRNGRTDEEFAKWRIARDDAYQAWQDEQITVELVKRESDTIETGIRWAMKNRAKVWPVNNHHILSILDTFQTVDDEDE